MRFRRRTREPKLVIVTLFLWILVFLVTIVFFHASSAADDGKTEDCQAPPILEHCQDKLIDCDTLASSGECSSNPQYMVQECPLTCGHCRPPPARIKQDDNNECRDVHPNCDQWASQGACDQASVQEQCPMSCQLCPVTCRDLNEKCPELVESGDCSRNPRYMNVHCRKSCQLCRNADEIVEDPRIALARFVEHLQGGDFGALQQLDYYGLETKDVEAHIVRQRNYLKSLGNSSLPPMIIDMCKNFEAQCTVRSMVGECDTFDTFMKRHCAPACFSCDYLTVEGRCPLDDNINEQNVWKSGDLDEMFEKLILQQEYESTILSRPPDGPWLVQLDGVLSAQEALEFIELGAIQGYEASGDVGSLRADGTAIANYNEFRTSTNSWCLKDCSKNTTISNVMERLSSLISIPPSHSEHLQLLKYQPNQFYRIHHDYIEHHTKRRQGPRILTAFLYLSDMEEGGGTNFDKIQNITIQPKVGRSLFWPNVLSHNPMEKDPRTTHQALAVKTGIKYAANAWYHLRDYKSAWRDKCT